MKECITNPTQQNIEMKMREFLENDLQLFPTCTEEICEVEGIDLKTLAENYNIVAITANTAFEYRRKSDDAVVLGVRFYMFDDQVKKEPVILKEFYGYVFDEKEKWPKTMDAVRRAQEME